VYREIHNISGEEKTGMTMSKLCCNYYSFGVESRVGLGLEKNR